MTARMRHRGDSDAYLYCCPQCRNTIRIRPEDIGSQVACPYCHRIAEPWLVMGGPVDAANAGPLPPGVVPAPGGSMRCSWRHR